MFLIWTIDKVMQLPNGRIIEMKYPGMFEASYNKYYRLTEREISIEITA